MKATTNNSDTKKNAGGLAPREFGDDQAATGGQNGLPDQGAEPMEKKGGEPIEDFDNMNLRDDLLRGIYSYGFEKPTPIQQRAIKPLADIRDVLAQAQSGTGKTGAFTIPLLVRLLRNPARPCADCSPRAIILAPTRELATQIARETARLHTLPTLRARQAVGLRIFSHQAIFFVTVQKEPTEAAHVPVARGNSRGLPPRPPTPCCA